MDLVVSGRNVFILYLVLAGSFLQPLFPCHSNRLIADSMVIRHILGFLTLIFFVVITDTEVDNYLSFGKIMGLSAMIYLWFLISSKMTSILWVVLLFILAGLYALDLYDNRLKTTTPDWDALVEKLKIGTISVAGLVTITGFLIYLGEKKIQYKSQFDYVTFILGTPTCKETEHDIPYLDAFKAAFTSYK